MLLQIKTSKVCARIILKFIYARKASQIQVCKLYKIYATVEIHLYQHTFEHETQKYATSDLSQKLLLKEQTQTFCCGRFILCSSFSFSFAILNFSQVSYDHRSDERKLRSSLR